MTMTYHVEFCHPYFRWLDLPRQFHSEQAAIHEANSCRAYPRRVVRTDQTTGERIVRYVTRNH